jgi:hypothetical protein
MGEGAEAQDPEKWWESLRNVREVRYQLLRAMAAEVLCEVVREIETDCSNCGGKGYVTNLSTAGKSGRGICPVCKGVAVVIKVRYR